MQFKVIVPIIRGDHSLRVLWRDIGEGVPDTQRRAPELGVREESPGAAMLAAKQGGHLRLGEQVVQLSCQVAKYNLSAHADAEQLVHIVAKVNPRHLILVHRAPDALEALARRFAKLQVDVPRVGEKVTCRGHIVALPPGIPATATSLSSSEAFAAAPSIGDLWAVALRHGPTRPWTAMELGQHYYGAAYRPALRSQVEGVLQEASTYFKVGRLGAQPTYQPRAKSEVEQLRPESALLPGEVVLVQGPKGPFKTLLANESKSREGKNMIR